MTDAGLHMHDPAQHATHTEVPESLPPGRPRRLATPLINAGSPTLWEIRVMKSDSGVRAAPPSSCLFLQAMGSRVVERESRPIY